MELYKFLQLNNFNGILIPELDTLLEAGMSVKEINDFYKKSSSDIELNFKCILLADFLYAKYNNEDKQLDSFEATSCKISISKIFAYMCNNNLVTFCDFFKTVDLISDNRQKNRPLLNKDLEYFNLFSFAVLENVLIKIKNILRAVYSSCN